MQSDSELVEAVLGGDRDSFAALVRRYERTASAVALNVLGNKHAAEDAVQEAFVKAYQKLGSLQKPEAFGYWLMKIAKRCALDMTRATAKEGPLADYAAQAYSGNGKLDDDNRQLLEAVVRLPDAEQQVVMLRYFGGHSVRDVAQAAGRSVGTVTKQLSRAHRRLRGMLKEVER